VRRLRTLLRTGKLSRPDYERLVDQQVAFAIGVQEAVGLDVLVHGEPERTDMVEYFGVQLGGLAFTLQVRGCGLCCAIIYQSWVALSLGFGVTVGLLVQRRG
jgi:methionine synthase II (cobalamin-independent)